MTRWLIGLDIDETQIPERTHPQPFEGENESIKALQGHLNALRDRKKAVIVHVTNGMRHMFDKVAPFLAEPDYLACNASTEIYKNNDGQWELDAGFQALIEDCHYDPAYAEEIAGEYEALKQTGPEHQTSLKRSFYFHDFTMTRGERLATFTRLKEALSERPGMTAFYVEGKMDTNGLVDPKGPHATIDILPVVCTKGGIIDYLARREEIPAKRVVTAGNGDNDISMMRHEFNTITVGNAQAQLKAHSRSLAAVVPERHLMPAGIRSASVLAGLGQLKIK
jgi:hydroxymethylpyrimidine pyrophosphatase-like HAD family hydrolase